MQAEAARNILSAAARCAEATDALFEAFSSTELSDEDAVTVATDYCEAKQAFDNAVTSRGVIA